MAYNTKYILSLKNDLNELYQIYFDFLDFVGVSQNLMALDGGLTVRSTSADDQKLTYILGTECLISIAVLTPAQNAAFNVSAIGIIDLIAQHDNDIRITVYKDFDYTKSIFQGFVVVEDNSQPFLDPPFTLSIRALDGLGLLKGVDMVDTNGNSFVGGQSIISWIAQILYKTNQTLNIRTFFNFYNSAYIESVSPLEETDIDAITFKQAETPPTLDPSVDIHALNADDCFTALEKICRNFRCRLFMEDGVWMLVSLFEYLNPNGYNFFEYELLTPLVSTGLVPVNTVDFGLGKTYNLNIGKNEIVHPVNDDAILYLKLATKFIDLTYNYDQSLNKICNQDFTQGPRNVTYDEIINSSIIEPSINPPVNLQTQGYDLFCWDHFQAANTTGAIVPNILPAVTPTKRAFIRSVVDSLGYEIERFLVVDNVDGSDTAYVKSSSFLIDSNDKLRITFDNRTRVDQSYGLAAGHKVAALFLTGDDGSFWAMQSAEGPGVTSPLSNLPTWTSVDSNFHNTFGNTPLIIWSNDGHTITWDNVGFGTFLNNLPIAPVSGTCHLYLLTSVSSPTNEAWFKNISVEIFSFLQGSYTQLKGDFNFSSSDNNIKQTLSEDVQISDSPKRYFKGALLNQDGVSLSPPNWHRRGVIETMRFTQAMERIMFNHIYRMLQKVEGHFRGLVYLDNEDFTSVRPNGFLNSYYFTDSPNPDKRYILTSFEKDYVTGIWRGVFVEVLKDINDDGWANPDNYVFQYVFQ